MIRIGLLGAGRIGRTHARAVAALPDAEIASVFDPDDDAAAHVQSLTGGSIATVDDILADPAIDAVIIATPTDCHADQIEQAARAGKAIFCEKPIDLDVGRVRACLKVVEETNARLMVGFNRRFDPNFAELKRRIVSGAIGNLEMVQIVSRDPAPPPIHYVRRSGGLFRDMMIHDFDMARFLLDEDPVEVSAFGSVLVDPAIGTEDDVDSAAATLVTASGRIVQISNSRRAVYGYDQRVEVHGSGGLVSAGNVKASTVTLADAAGIRADPPLDFFMERYAEAYHAELAAFAAGLKGDVPLRPDGQDGLKALLIADAADRSRRTDQAVRVAYD